MTNEPAIPPATNLIREAIEEDLRSRSKASEPVSRPNQTVICTSAKAICIDFGSAEAFGGSCNYTLR